MKFNPMEPCAIFVAVHFLHSSAIGKALRAEIHPARLFHSYDSVADIYQCERVIRKLLKRQHVLQLLQPEIDAVHMF